MLLLTAAARRRASRGSSLAVSAQAKFSDQHVLNDAEVEVLELTEGFAKIRVCDDGNGLVEGWLRQRNLTRQKRTVGLRAHATAAAGQSSFVKRGATISNLMPSHEEETAERHASTAGFDRLMAINGVKAGLMSSPERKRMQVALAKQAGSIRRQLKRQRRLTFDPHSKCARRLPPARGRRRRHTCACPCAPCACACHVVHI